MRMGMDKLSTTLIDMLEKQRCEGIHFIAAFFLPLLVVLKTKLAWVGS